VARNSINKTANVDQKILIFRKSRVFDTSFLFLTNLLLYWFNIQIESLARARACVCVCVCN